MKGRQLEIPVCVRLQDLSSICGEMNEQMTLGFMRFGDKFSSGLKKEEGVGHMVLEWVLAFKMS
jgi:hypothetical protein